MDNKLIITVRLEGLDIDNGNVQIKAFIKQLEIIQKALFETERILSDSPIAYYRIADLSHNSPARIVFEAVPIESEKSYQAEVLVAKFFNSIEQIDNGVFPEGFTYETFKAYQDLTCLREKNRIKQILISRNGGTPNNLEKFSMNIDEIIGEDEFEFGTYTGKLEYLNIHRNQNVFYLYPTTNSPKLKCSFPQFLREQVIAAIDHYVKVFGEKKFKPNLKSSYPYEMKVTKIEVFPKDDTLPKLFDLRGISPRIIGDEKSEEFVKRIRDGW